MSFKPLRVYGSGLYHEEYVSFEAEAEDLLQDYDRYEKYVKGCEEMVREDDRYTAYIAKLKNGGMTKCAIMGSLPTDEPKLKIEMHHGPIFNLFDICDIVLRANLLRGNKKVTTFSIADMVLTEHENDNIMIVMLSKPVHMGGAHNKRSNRGIFLDIRATFGRLDRFIDHWHDGMEAEHKGYIRRYCEECRRAEHQSLDQGLFDVAEKMESFE
ncbi:MAG: hypothetical protein NC311_05585 [Muribaculaceae bacterium]|nr:hypothetical protein [Muribaculaceae bacterium]